MSYQVSEIIAEAKSNPIVKDRILKFEARHRKAGSFFISLALARRVYEHYYGDLPKDMPFQYAIYYAIAHNPHQDVWSALTEAK